jgi:FkbM family methyltransferase
MIRAVRQLARLALKATFRAAPSACGLYAARRCPRLVSCLPAGRDHVLADYPGRYRVTIDVRYPIERAMLAGPYEPELLSLIRKLVPAGGVCLDVGANVGAVALGMADRVGPSGQVLAFEPGPFLFQRLTANVRRNPGLKEVMTLVNQGVSDSAGALFWKEDANNRGNAGLNRIAGTRVEVIALDDYFRQHPIRRLDFCKVDVEGMEYEVLRGGFQTWQRYRPVLYFETLREFEAIRGFPVLRRIEQLLTAIGYKLYRPDSAGNLAPAGAAEFGANTAALPAA